MSYADDGSLIWREGFKRHLKTSTAQRQILTGGPRRSEPGQVRADYGAAAVGQGRQQWCVPARVSSATDREEHHPLSAWLAEQRDLEVVGTVTKGHLLHEDWL